MAVEYINECVSRIHTYIDDASVCAEVCENLYFCKQMNVDTLETDVIPAVITALTTHANDEHVYYWMIQLFERLTYGTKANVIPPVVTALTTHGDDIDMCRWADEFFVLYNVHIDDTDVVSTVMNVLKTHGDNVHVCEWVFKGLEDFAWLWKDAIKQTLYNADNIPTFVNLLIMHTDSMIIAVSICDILRDHSDDPTIREAGGIPAIVSALNIHVSDVNACETICQTLHFLTLGEIFQRPNAELICEANGIPVIVNALKTHANNKNVCSEACSVLDALAYNNANRDAIRDAGGIPVFILILNTCCGTSACSLLEEMTKNIANLDAIRSAGGITTMIHVLKTSKNNELRCLSMCTALKNMMSCEANKPFIHAEREFIESVITFHKNNTSNRTTQ